MYLINAVHVAPARAVKQAAISFRSKLIRNALDCGGGFHRCELAAGGRRRVVLSRRRVAARGVGRRRSWPRHAQVRLQRGAAHPDLRRAHRRASGTRACPAARDSHVHLARGLGRGCIHRATLRAAAHRRGRPGVVCDVAQQFHDLSIRGAEPGRRGVLATGDVRHGARGDGVDGHHGGRLPLWQPRRRHPGPAPAHARWRRRSGCWWPRCC